MKYHTQAGIELTDEQCKLIDSFKRLMKKWDGDLCINSIAGSLTIMLIGDTEQNKTPEMSNTGGFNQDNIVIMFNEILSDGGDW